MVTLPLAVDDVMNVSVDITDRQVANCEGFLTNAGLCTDLLDEDGEPLVLEGLGELDVLSALVVDGEGGHDHVSQASQ